MVSPEGCYLVGNPRIARFNRAFNQALGTGELFDRDVSVLFLVVYPKGWRDQFASLVAPRPFQAVERYHYVCRSVQHDWRAALPEDCRVRPIDRAQLAEQGEALPDHILGWMKGNWGSAEAFLRHGFGTLTACGGDVVSWSLADCASGRASEIGIRTGPSHRRRGLAAATAAANVELALSSGFDVVGWHCPRDNVGSIHTAEKVGFELERVYRAYFARLD